MKSWNAYHFVGDKLRDGSPVPADGVKLIHTGKLKLWLLLVPQGMLLGVLLGLLRRLGMLVLVGWLGLLGLLGRPRLLLRKNNGQY